MPFAQRFVGGDLAGRFDDTVTGGTGGLIMHLLALTFVVALAGYLYRRKVFLRV